MATVNWSLQHFTDTAANFTANNPTLLAGQLGIETDGLTTTPKFKIGDGVTAWNTLPYFYGGSASAQDLNNVLSVGNSSGNLSAKFGTGYIYFGGTNQTHIQYVNGLELHNTTANTLVNLGDTGRWKVDAVQYMPNLSASSILSLDANKEIVTVHNTTGSGTTLVLSTSPTIATDITIGTTLVKSINNISNTSITTTNYSATYPLKNITTGDYNIGIGGNCQQDNTTGSYNISIGTDSMTHLTSGTYNVSTGAGAMGLNTFTGSYNTSFGTDSLRSITTGNYNAGFGHYTQFSITTGDYNCSLGANSLNGNTNGSYNVAIGYASASLLNGGSYNVCVGFGAGDTSTSANANVSGTYNTFIGTYSGPSTATQYSNSIAIGYNAQVSASNQAVLGSSTITSTILRPTVNIDPSSSTSYSTTLTVNTSNYDALSLYNSDASAGMSCIRFAAKASGASIGRIALVSTVGYGAFSFMLRSTGDTSNTTEFFRIDSSAITPKDAVNFVFGSTTGNKIGTATTQKIGFWNATPIVQPANNTAIDTLLVNTGLQATGGTTTYFDKLIYGNAVATSGTNGYGAFFNITTGATNNWSLGTNGRVNIAIGGVTTTSSIRDLTISGILNSGGILCDTAASNVAAAWRFARAGTEGIYLGYDSGSNNHIALINRLSGDLYFSSNNTKRMVVDANGSIVLGAQSALSTSATDGFVYIPTSAGAPTGVPTSYTGKVAMQYDTSNNKLYIYNGAWKSVTLA